MGNLDLKATDDKKTQEAFDWYRDITSKMGGDKAFGSLTFAGITQHVARYALVKVGFIQFEKKWTVHRFKLDVLLN